MLFYRYAVPDFPLAVDSKIQCENLNKIINELLKGKVYFILLIIDEYYTIIPVIENYMNYLMIH